MYHEGGAISHKPGKRLACRTAREEVMGLRELDTQAVARRDLLLHTFRFFGDLHRLRFPFDRNGFRAHPATICRDGRNVIWLGALPSSTGITNSDQATAPERGGVLFEITHPDQIRFPEPTSELRPWLSDGWRDHDWQPRLRDSVVDPSVDGPLEDRILRLNNHPGVAGLFRPWHHQWRYWADSVSARQSGIELYKLAVDFVNRADHNSDRLELALVHGLGPSDPFAELPSSLLRRPVLTTPIVLEHDVLARTIRVIDPADTVTIEPRPAVLIGTGHDGLAKIVEQMQGSRLGHTTANNLLQQIADALGLPTAPYSGAGQPALILRPRSQAATTIYIDALVNQLGHNPKFAGCANALVSSPYLAVRPKYPQNQRQGAIVEIENQQFTPNPLDDRQLAALDTIADDTHPVTVLHSSSGADSTTTLAVLVSHLIARGQRVLVTARSDQPLKAIRDQLPELARSITLYVPSGSGERSALTEQAVNEIKMLLDKHDSSIEVAPEPQLVKSLSELGHRLAAVHRRCDAIRSFHTAHHVISGYEGTVESIAKQLDSDAEAYRWINAGLINTIDQPPAITSKQALTYLGLCHNRDLMATAAESRNYEQILHPSSLPTVDQFSLTVNQEAQAAMRLLALTSNRPDPALDQIRRLDQPVRERLTLLFEEMSVELEGLYTDALRDKPWLTMALTQLAAGDIEPWRHAQQTAHNLVGLASGEFAGLSPETQIVCTGTIDQLLPMADNVQLALNEGKQLRLDETGMPRLGVFSAKPFRDNYEFFEQVRVNSRPPCDEPSIALFTRWATGHRFLDDLDQIFPSTNGSILSQQSPHQRLEQHKQNVEALSQLFATADRFGPGSQELAEAGLDIPDWSSLESVTRYRTALNLATAEVIHREAAHGFQQILNTFAPYGKTDKYQKLGSPQSNGWLAEIHAAVVDRDPPAYLRALQRLEQLNQAKDAIDWMDDIESRLKQSLPWIREAVEIQGYEVWRPRLEQFESAWRWRAASLWLEENTRSDQATINAQESAVVDEIHRTIGLLVGARARRLFSSAEADGADGADSLSQSSQFPSIGSVPACFMPLHRVASDLDPTPGQFDVVVIHQADELPVEAAFALFVGSRVVIIGDPSTPNPPAPVDPQAARDLTDRYNELVVPNGQRSDLLPLFTSPPPTAATLLAWVDDLASGGLRRA